jgi:PTS system mannose-specific IID component
MPEPRSERRLWLLMQVRALALQASWNPQRMQNLGLLAVLVPWLRSRGCGVEERRRFARRHYEFFNTNPYLANFVIGGILRLESEGSTSNGISAPTMRTFRNSLAPSFAGLGDQLFWLGLRPGVLLLAALFAFFGSPGGALAVVAAFTLGQLELRRRALQSGYARGFEIVDVLVRPGWHRAIELSKNAGKLLTGAVAGCFFGRILVAQSGTEAVGPLLAVAIGVALPPLARERLPGEAYLLVAAAMVVALAYVL